MLSVVDRLKREHPETKIGMVKVLKRFFVR